MEHQVEAAVSFRVCRDEEGMMAWYVGMTKGLPWMGLCSFYILEMFKIRVVGVLVLLT